MTDPQDPKIKVVDRRRFTDSGELREDRAPSPPPRPRSEEPPSRPRSEEPPPQPRSDEPPSRPSSDESSRDRTAGPSAQRQPATALFMELVNDLAQQAVLLIEGAEGFPAQPAQARRIIDYLSMLEDKTKGNLSREEEGALTEIVFQLRSLYLKRGK